jgi:hypothetical protein
MVGVLILKCKVEKALVLLGRCEGIQSLGGQLIIANQPGQGTEVTAIGPLAIDMPSQTTAGE